MDWFQTRSKAAYDEQQQSLRWLEQAMANGTLPDVVAIPIGASAGSKEKKNRTWLIAGAVVIGLLVFWA